MEVPMLGQDRPKGDEEAGGLLEADTAFLVFRTKDGSYGVSPDINVPITIENAPSLTDVKTGLVMCLEQMRVNETALATAQHVMNAQMSMARQVMENQANQAALAGKKLR